MTIELQSTSQESIQLKPPSVPIRGTQSFLGTIGRCWKTPSLLGLELLWRWGIGIPIICLLLWEAWKILSSVSLAHTGIEHFLLIDTVMAAQILSAIADALLPHIRVVAIWLAPLLVVAWSLASGFGRSLVLRRYDRTLRSKPWLLVGMQMLRIVTLGGSFILWFLCLHWAAWTSLSGSDPDLVTYFVKAIFLSFAVFGFWVIVSWVFSIAPLLALLEGTGMFQSMRASLRLGHGSLRGLRPKLVEVNLILSIVKVALLVLAMVFCATPMPFKEEINGPSLYAWWALVTVWYFVASDFFQMTRVIGFIELWRSANQSSSAAGIASDEKSAPLS